MSGWVALAPLNNAARLCGKMFFRRATKAIWINMVCDNFDNFDNLLCAEELGKHDHPWLSIVGSTVFHLSVSDIEAMAKRVPEVPKS